MVQNTKTRDRKGLLAKQPLVPYADDGPAAKAALALIHNEMLSYGEQYDDMDKERPRWTRLLREARFKDLQDARRDNIATQ